MNTTDFAGMLAVGMQVSCEEDDVLDDESDLRRSDLAFAAALVHLGRDRPPCE